MLRCVTTDFLGPLLRLISSNRPVFGEKLVEQCKNLERASLFCSPELLDDLIQKLSQRRLRLEKLHQAKATAKHLEEKERMLVRVRPVKEQVGLQNLITLVRTIIEKLEIFKEQIQSKRDSDEDYTFDLPPSPRFQRPYEELLSGPGSEASQLSLESSALPQTQAGKRSDKKEKRSVHWKETLVETRSPDSACDRSSYSMAFDELSMD